MVSRIIQFHGLVLTVTIYLLDFAAGQCRINAMGWLVVADTIFEKNNHALDLFMTLKKFNIKFTYWPHKYDICNRSTLSENSKIYTAKFRPSIILFFITSS